MSSLIVEVYGKKDCSLCKEATRIIGRVNEEMPFKFKHVDISKCEDLTRRYSDNIPTVFINGQKVFKFRVDEGEFRKKVRKEFIRSGLSRLKDKTESVARA